MPGTTPQPTRFKSYLYMLLRVALVALVAGGYLLSAQSQGHGTQSMFSEIGSALVPEEPYTLDPAATPLSTESIALPTANPSAEPPLSIATQVETIEAADTPTETATPLPTEIPTTSVTEPETPTGTPTETPTLQPTFAPTDTPPPTETPTVEEPKATPGDTLTGLPAVDPSPAKPRKP